LEEVLGGFVSNPCPVFGYQAIGIVVRLLYDKTLGNLDAEIVKERFRTNIAVVG